MRFFCVVLFHIMIETEVRQTISMFKYMNYHVSNFVNKDGDSSLIPAALLILMQLGASLATEVINLVLIVEAKNPKEALMNFVALGIICEIDDIVFHALKKEPLKAAVEPDNCPVIKNTTKSVRI
jgi:hypothetical protein